MARGVVAEQRRADVGILCKRLVSWAERASSIQGSPQWALGLWALRLGPRQGWTQTVGWANTDTPKSRWRMPSASSMT